MIHHPLLRAADEPAHQLYIPARYVSDLQVSRGADLLFKMEGGISISENPTFRFSVKKEGSGDNSVRAKDTEGREFRGSWPVGASGS